MTTNSLLEPLQEIFLSLGLSADSSLLFRTVLEHPHSSAGRLASLSKLKRGNTYNILGDLLSKGLLEESSEGGVKRFTAHSPETIVQALRSRVHEQEKLLKKAEDIVPFLKGMLRSSRVTPQVKIFRGEDGVKAVYEDSLLAKDRKILAVADFATTFPSGRNAKLNKWMWEYADRRAKAGIWYYGIVNTSRESDKAYRSRKKQKRVLKALHGVVLEVEIFLYDDKVAITSTALEMMGMIIENGPLVKSLRSVHEAFWGWLPEYKPFSKVDKIL